MKEYTDKEIIDCLRNRQSYVVRYLSDRYLPMVRLMVLYMGGNDEDAKDVFQDGLIIMLEKIDDRNFTLTCKFKTYLYSVCENLWKSVLEKRQTATTYVNTISDTEDYPETEDMIDNKLYQKIFREVFESLEPSYKTILSLHWQDMSPKEIADKLGQTNGYVRKKKCEAQAELIGKVKKHPDYLKVVGSEKVTKNVVY